MKKILLIQFLHFDKILILREMKQTTQGLIANVLQM